MSTKLKLYVMTVINENGDDDIIEIPAYSEDQADYLAEMDGQKVINTECAVAKYN